MFQQKNLAATSVAESVDKFTHQIENKPTLKLDRVCCILTTTFKLDVEIMYKKN